MTWLGIAVLGFVLLSCGIGYRRGFVRETVSLMFMVVSILIVWAINPYVSSFLKDHTPVYRLVKERCEDVIVDQISGREEEQEEEKEVSQGQNALIEALPLPESIKESLSENNTLEVYQYLAVDTFAEYIADYLAVIITNGIGFLLSYLLAIIGLRLVVHVLDLMAHLPVLRGVNSAAGAVVGFFRGIVIVWIAFLVMTIFISTQAGKACMQMIQKDVLLSALYGQDIFVEIFMSIFYGK